MKTLAIHGKTWFNKSVGSTYHSAQILVDGVEVEGVEYAYGYSSQYLESAKKKLVSLGFIPDIDDKTPLWRYCEEKGITFHYDCTEVKRKKDL